ncbi:hypothetical protein B296_00014363 [Ensete ventricosum]|uniref:Uncharacterized protein n=1 Tax=Ensete ventricosum TaxID=4639 RepID=A0A427AYA6_ENSVE|nr:hypothetical protein B296_00014363 [Ensete ventricosum]
MCCDEKQSKIDGKEQRAEEQQRQRGDGLQKHIVGYALRYWLLCFDLLCVRLVEKEEAVEAVTTNEDREEMVGEIIGGDERELDHHVIGATCEGIRDDEVGGGGDEDTQEKEKGP